MHRHAKLESLANSRSFYAGAYPTPESSVEQNDIHCRVKHISSELLEVHHHRIRRQRNVYHLPDSAHAVQPKNGIFQIIVANPGDALPESNGLLSRPNAVRIESKR